MWFKILISLVQQRIEIFQFIVYHPLSNHVIHFIFRIKFEDFGAGVFPIDHLDE